MELSTRLRILVVSVTIPIIFFVLTLIEFDNEFIKDYKLGLVALVVGILEMIAVAWVVSFRIRGERMFSVLVFPAVSLAILLLFFQVVVITSDKELDKISTLAGSALLLGVVTYILTANINILNLAAIDNIPLGQAGRAAHYVLTMIFSYFAFVLIVSWNTQFLVKILVVLGLVFTFTFTALWTISLQYSQRILSTVAVSLMMLFIFLVLSLWPIDSFYFALFMVLNFYMSLGVALEIREIVNRWLWYEYASIFAIILILLLTIASWGINGTII